MSGCVRYLVQKDLIRFDLAEFVRTAEQPGREVVLFDAIGDWRTTLAALEADLPPMCHPMVFGSIQAISHIRRHHPRLAAGTIVDFDQLSVSAWLGRLPARAVLNRNAVFLPFGRLADRAEMLEAAYGPWLFVRPDRSTKSFPGQQVAVAGLDRFIGDLRQLHHVADDELILVDRARRIHRDEYRFWISDGKILSHAPYAHDPGRVPAPCLAELREFVEGMLDPISAIQDPVVADFVLDEIGEPRLIELNGFSTSGFYSGVDFGALARGVEEFWRLPGCVLGSSSVL